MLADAILLSFAMLRVGGAEVPLYDFECRKCHHQFEDLVSSASDARCPKCETADVEQLLSAFAVGGSSANKDAIPAGCGSCGDPRGPGACRWGAN